MRFWRLVIAGGIYAALLGPSTAPATVPGADGRIAFVAGLGFGQIYVAGPDGSSSTLVAEGAAPGWSPDGRKLVFFRRTPGPCAPCNFALDVLDVAAGTRTTIFEGTTFDPAPAWSPDGTQIAFVNQRAGSDEIWLVGADGTSPRHLTTTRDNFGPAWSPDGARIAFYGFGLDGVHLYVVNADGSDVRQLTTGVGFDLRPSWSPDGRQIAFMSDRSGSFELYVMNADGSGARALTSGAPASACRTGGCTFPFSNPSWSPTGTRIVFSSDRSGSNSLYIVSVDSGSLVRIPEVFGAIDPDWQPAVDLKITRVSGPARIRVGKTATFRLALTNTAPRPATGVRLTLAVGTRLALVSRSAFGETLAPGATATVSFVVRARRAGTAVVRAAVTSAEAEATSGDNQRSARLTVARRGGAGGR